MKKSKPAVLGISLPLASRVLETPDLTLELGGPDSMKNQDSITEPEQLAIVYSCLSSSTTVFCHD